MGKNGRNFLGKHIVTISFTVICVLAFWASKVSAGYFLQELTVRISRNAVLVLALIIPVITGLGLNFSIVLGAMAAQTALILITHWHIGGVGGISLACVLAVPLAVFLGWLMGSLFNRTKGQEMITGMIAGYFANGVYQFIFIVLLGSLIPFHDTNLMLSGGVGIKSTIVLESPKALDELFMIRCDLFLLFTGVICAALGTGRCIRSYILWKKRGALNRSQGHPYAADIILASAGLLLAALSRTNEAVLTATRTFFVPAGTILIGILVAAICTFLTKTKLGQNFRAAGQDRRVAMAAGINVDRTRMTAIVISTVIAAIGQVLSLQNIGSFATYSAHDGVATYAIAALLVGGASVKEAKIRHVFIGLTLFHALFIVAPQAGIQLFGNPVYGEYFRVFVSYGVIALSLIFHAVQTQNRKMKQLKAATAQDNG